MSENNTHSATPSTRRGRVKYDFLLVIGVLLFALLMYLIFALGGRGGGEVVIRVNGEEVSRYSLFVDRDFTVGDVESGSYNTVVIRDGSVYVSEAGCPDKICVEHRPISKSGETVVCLPLKLVVEVE